MLTQPDVAPRFIYRVVASTLLILATVSCADTRMESNKRATIDLAAPPSADQIRVAPDNFIFIVQNRDASPLPLTIVNGKERFHIEVDFVDFTAAEMAKGGPIDAADISLPFLTRREMLKYLDSWIFPLASQDGVVQSVTDWLAGPLPHTTTTNSKGWVVRMSPACSLHLQLRYWPQDQSSTGIVKVIWAEQQQLDYV